MPTQNADTAGTAINHQLDTTVYTWADTRNGSTGNGFVLISPTSTNPLAQKSTSRGSNWQISRVFIKFDLSSVTGTIMTPKKVTTTNAVTVSNTTKML